MMEVVQSQGTEGKARPVRVIIVAGDENAKVLLDALERGVGVKEYVRAEDAATLKSAVQRKIWDVVLSDWGFEKLSTVAALDVLHELHRGVPLIVCSGRVGEEAAVDAMRAGARDFVLFGNTARLNAVIMREVIGDAAARNLRDVMRTGLLAHSGGIGITLTTLDGQFLDANDAFLRMLGYSRDDLVAGRIHRTTITPPEFDAEDRAAVARIQSEGSLEPRQKEYIRKDGSRLPVLVSGLRLDDGTAVGFIVLDVTEQKRVERKLRSTTVFLDSILENMPLVVFVKDAKDLRFERLNRFAEKVLGHERADMLGKNVYDLYPKEQADFFEAKDREALASRSSVDVTEEPVATPDGERWFRTMKMAIRDERGVARHLLGIAEDITDKREMAAALARTEERFRQAQKMEAIGQLAGGMAHDFNNLLTVILSYVALIKDALSPSDPLREEIAEIGKAGTRAADLTRQLLAFTRQQVAAPRVVDLNEAVGSAEKMLRRVIAESIDVRTVLTPHLWKVLADPTQIEQILMNLVVNARDAMPAAGHLTIETANVTLDEEFAQAHVGAKTGPHVMLAVSDSGVGMDKETRARIFEPFFTTKGPGKGTGLGLSTVYGIVQQSGGTIWVYTEPGQGTTFKIYLPRIEDTGAAMATTVSLPPATVRRGTETVLLVEDDEQLRCLARNVLGRGGYTVLEASGPADAILASEQHRGTIHLLLTDVVMPRMNGKELANRLSRTRPEMRVIFMSGYTGNVIGHHGLLDPRLTLIQKPFTPQTLLAKIAEVLDG